MSMNRSRVAFERSRIAAFGAGLMMSVAFAPQVFAQSEPITGGQKSIKEIEVVTVTAERRETLLQETPVAITAISGATIDQQHLYNLGDVAVRTPSVSFSQINASESFFAIRGLNSDNDSAGIDQGVTLFIDDVPTTGFGDNSPLLYDLQNVEVLRGPQGTLFGRNVVGGAILLHTLPPSFNFAARGTITYGSNNLMESAGYITGPLIGDELAGKLTFDLKRRDNYLDNTILGGKTLGENVGTIRSQLLWRPRSDLKVLIGGDFLNDTSPAKAQYLIGNFQPSLFPPLSYSPNHTNQGSNSDLNKKVFGLMTRVDWTLPFATATSITGYRNVRSNLHFSTSGDPFNSILSDPIVRDDQLSEELRFTSPDKQRLTWVAGAFFLHAHRAYLQTIHYAIQPGTIGWVAAHIDPANAVYQTPFTNYLNQHVATDTQAVFGEVSYAITDKLKLTLGERLIHDSKSGHTEIFNDSAVQPVNIASGPYSKSWTSSTPKAVLSWQLHRSLLFYTSVTNGFESGGYDTNGSTPAELASAYNPEKVWSYEVGGKSEFLERRAQLNISLFDAEYTDLQTRNYDALSGLIIAGNAASARVRGAELEGQLIPVDWLTLTANYTYTDATFRKYLLANPSGPPTDNSGHKIPHTPPNKLTLGAVAQFYLAKDHGSIEFGGDITYASRIQLDDFNDTAAFVRNKSAIDGNANLHFTWTSANRLVNLTFWAKNVLDRRWIIDTADVSLAYDTPAEYFAGKQIYIANWGSNGRTMGVSLTGRF